MINYAAYEERLNKLGKRIEALRIARGCTKFGFSKFSGIDVARLTAYEDGGNMNIVTLFALADALEVSPGTLLEGGDDHETGKPVIRPRSVSHFKSLVCIMERCVGMTLKDVDPFLIVYHTNNPHLAIMYQAAKNLDAQGVDASAILEDSELTLTQQVTK